MKTIKFFSFALLLSLIWVACKNANTTTEETSTLSAEVVASKSIAADNIAQLKTALAAKISELEATVATAEEDAKVELTTQIENFKKHEADLQALATKVEEATEENWAAITAEVDSTIRAIKIALTGVTPELGVSPTGQPN